MRAVLGTAKAVLTIIRFKLTSTENVLFYFILDSEVYKKTADDEMLLVVRGPKDGDHHSH